MAGRPHVLVLGGGVIGVASAYELCRRGCQVTLVERQPGVALETSFANGSLVTPSQSDPWAAPGLPQKLLRWIGREDAPFLLRPSALPGLISWGLAFLRNCDKTRWEHNASTIHRLTQYSLEALQQVAADTGIAYDRATVGTMRLLRDPLSMDAARRGAATVAALGVRVEALDAAGCARLEPALAPAVERIAGGIHFPDDESGDAHRFSRALADLCRDAGVDFRFGTEVLRIDAAGDRVTGIITSTGRLEADRYLVALGWNGARVLRTASIRVPIYPVKGYSATVDLDGWNGAPTVPLVDDGRKMGIVRLGDRLRLAGTAEFAGASTDLNPARGQNLIDGVRSLFPDVPYLERARHWSGLRPMTPDGIPILGASRYHNLFLNLGHGHLGWTMACGSARILGDLIAGRAPEIDVSDMTLAARE